MTTAVQHSLYRESQAKGQRSSPVPRTSSLSTPFAPSTAIQTTHDIPILSFHPAADPDPRLSLVVLWYPACPALPYHIRTLPPFCPLSSLHPICPSQIPSPPVDCQSILPVPPCASGLKLPSTCWAVFGTRGPSAFQQSLPSV